MRENTALTVAATLLAGSGLLTAASPADAADHAPRAVYGGECGTGYRVVNHHDIAGLGTVFLTYKSDPAHRGWNCVVTKRNTPGSPVYMVAYVRLVEDPANSARDAGRYRSYAGPVRINDTARHCVAWGGEIAGHKYDNPGSNCNRR